MTVLVTGGLGFIGSHTIVELIKQGEDCLIIDNLSRASIDILGKIDKIVNTKIRFLQIDLLDKDSLHSIFDENDITSVIHFAGFKSVNESITEPLMYYQNNLISTLNLLDVMQEFNVKKLVFSSSATVYGDQHIPPLKESLSLSVSNPYGRTKLMIEEICKDFANANKDWSIVLLRYFNPIGAHKSGQLGETSFGLPNNLMPHILKTASGESDTLKVFGGDYETKDGSCIRDFIHIVDLAKGHVKALNYIEHTNGCEAFNLGTGIGYSVLDLIHTFEHVNNVKVPYEIVARREGDIVISIANVDKANHYLQWYAKYNLDDMCVDSWKWYQLIKEKKV